MDQQEISNTLAPHVLIFPLPLQGPVNPMFKLAELLCLSGFSVTFLVSDYIHGRLLRYTDVKSRFDPYPGFHLETISDGLPHDNPRTGVAELFGSLNSVTKPLLKELLTSGELSPAGERGQVKCIIADGMMSFTYDVASEIGVPVIYALTLSPCCLWVFFCLPKLIEAGEVPLRENDLDKLIESVPGMTGFLRGRDLPSMCRSGDLGKPIMELAMKQVQEVPRAHGLILNTFEDLDEPVLSQIRTLCPNLYAIGPLHTHLRFMHESKMMSPTSTSSNSFWEENKSCITWLDSQQPKTVVYISIGSLAQLTWHQVLELWHGLLNSGVQFLWVRRPGSIVEQEGHISSELLKGTKERGFIVDWAPQETVLAHKAIGGYVTHSGWNSTLESIVEGVPMICWPSYADQQVNSRFASEVWKIGRDMKDSCDRIIIEKMIRDVMDLKGEIVENATRMAKLAKQSVSEGGSSYT